MEKSCREHLIKFIYYSNKFIFKDAESEAAKEFVKAAGSIDDIKFLTTSNDEVMKGIQAADGEIVLFKNFDEPRVDYSGEATAAVSTYLNCKILEINYSSSCISVSGKNLIKRGHSFRMDFDESPVHFC